VIAASCDPDAGRHRRKGPPVAAVELIQYNHMNQLVESYEGAVTHLTTTLGAQFLWEAPPNPFTRAGLVNFGGAIIELVEKRRPMGVRPASVSPVPGHRSSFWYCTGTTGFIMDWDRLGPHFAGCEFLVSDLSAAMSETRSLGLRVNDQSEWHFFLTYSEQCHGISFEITTVDWYATPSPLPYAEELRDSSYWRHEHPLGIVGYRFSVAVPDIDGTAAFYEAFCGATVHYEEDRPSVAARAIGLQLGNIVVDFLAPTGSGQISAFVDRYGGRIRSMIFEVDDLDAVRRYCDERRIALVGGDAPQSVAIVPDQNVGVMFQFEQHSDGGRRRRESSRSL
jgi:catechol 2,3-dioxygenase-like lactoylglutathione lyase family enzyme